MIRVNLNGDDKKRVNAHTQFRLWWRGKRDDQKSKPVYEDEHWVEYKKPTLLGYEIVEFEDLDQNKNWDMPDNLAFYDMGTSVRKTEHLDHQKMNDRDFRERCVQLNGKNYPLYLKGQGDIWQNTQSYA